MPIGNFVIWFFQRQGRRLQCELRTAADRDGFELIWTSADGDVRLEHNEDSTVLNERRIALESKLRADGWCELGNQGRHSTTQPTEGVSTMPTSSDVLKCTVLLVEDAEVTLELLNQYFTTHGCEVLQAKNPDDACRHLTTSAVDLVILDLYLEQGGSGLEVLELMRIDPRWIAKPVVVLTGMADVPVNDRAVIERCGAHLLSKSDGYPVIAEKLGFLMGALTTRTDSSKLH